MKWNLGLVASNFISSVFPDWDKESLEYKKNVYIFEGLLSDSTKMIMYAIIFAILGYFKTFAICLVSVCVPRAFAGGYHAKTYWGCFFVSLLGLASCVFASEFFPVSKEVYIYVALVDIIIVSILAPRDSIEKPIISKDYRKLQKIRSIALYILFSGIGFFWFSSQIICSLTLEVIALFYVRKARGDIAKA